MSQSQLVSCSCRLSGGGKEKGLEKKRFFSPAGRPFSANTGHRPHGDQQRGQGPVVRLSPIPAARTGRTRRRRPAVGFRLPHPTADRRRPSTAPCALSRHSDPGRWLPPRGTRPPRSSFSSAVSGEASCSLKRTDGSLYWASSFYGVLRLGLSIPGGKDVRKTELNHARIHSELANSLL